MLGKDDFVGGWIPVRTRPVVIKSAIILAVAGLTAGVWGLAAHITSAKGGAECAGYLNSAIEAKAKSIRADKHLLAGINDSAAPSAIEAKLKVNAEEKSAFDKEFADKVDQWKACVARKQQKNSPVAVQPRQVQPLQRARNAP